jgi:hypothetical protein
MAPLEHNIYHYFPSLFSQQYTWVRNLVAPMASDSNVSSLSKEESLAYLSMDHIL